MIYAPQADAPPSSAQISEIYRVVPPQLLAEEEPAEANLPRFIYRRHFLPLDGGKLLLRLWENPEVEVDPETLKCEVVNWGVSLPHDQIHDIDRQMARHFLELFTKAEAQRLTESETKTWLQILDQVDYASFCIERAAPHYVEGTLLNKQPAWLVEWHDGEKATIPSGPAAALRVLNENDRFGAFVKLGRNNEVRSIERVVILPSE